ncbi:MAG: hypothetical protein U0670_00160 [Anaerolineae bacterium]
MAYLVRLSKAPNTNDLTPEEISTIENKFQITPQAVTLNGSTLTWEEVTEIETAKAARNASPAGWFVRNFIFGGQERYHIAIYAGRAEAVLPNTSLRIVQHIVQTIAYYAPKKLIYSGLEGISPINPN